MGRKCEQKGGSRKESVGGAGHKVRDSKLKGFLEGVLWCCTASGGALAEVACLLYSDAKGEGALLYRVSRVEHVNELGVDGFGGDERLQVGRQARLLMDPFEWSRLGTKLAGNKMT